MTFACQTRLLPLTGLTFVSHQTSNAIALSTRLLQEFGTHLKLPYTTDLLQTTDCVLRPRSHLLLCSSRRYCHAVPRAKTEDWDGLSHTSASQARRRLMVACMIHYRRTSRPYGIFPDSPSICLFYVEIDFQSGSQYSSFLESILGVLARCHARYQESPPTSLMLVPVYQ